MEEVYHPAPTRANRLFWRTFLAVAGTLIGAFVGLSLTAAWGGANVILTAALCGAARTGCAVRTWGG